ncbi:MAG TPA: acyl-CoA dehydrogenase family protein [Ramlibacter sp.]|nr:acyl-CoA dehydrogenase family protein [Ramlibacter sp.]
MFAEAIQSILATHCTPGAVRAIEGGSSPQALAGAIAQAGFHELLAPEDEGGGGAAWREFFEVVALCGTYAVPLPLAQTLAARAIVRDRQLLPSGLITFAPALTGGADGSMHALHVPVARVASHVIAADGDTLRLLSVADAHQLPSGVHGSLAASLRWKRGSGLPLPCSISAAHFQALGALLHAGLLAGAMKRAFDMTMAYANERVQFGKPIGKFQAIQHQLSVMAEQVASARMAAEAAFATEAVLPTLAACAVAKARTSEAAQIVASTGHAVHGAIGITEEYDLQLFTRRLHEWRVAHGSESYWHRELGRLFVASEHPLGADFVRSLFQRVPA